jgi:plasmid maintenance system antidote protein VapI
MAQDLNRYYGIHPGRVLERELKKRELKKGPFAISIGEYPQVINEITKGRRGLSPLLSLKIDQAFGYEEGEFYLLQAHYEIDQLKRKLSQVNAPSFRKALFWDTDMSKIDWKTQYKAVIKRVFQRGNDEEKQLALEFYGKDKIEEVTGSDSVACNSMPIMTQINRK